MKFEEFTIETEDGIKLGVWQIEPETQIKGTIIQFHGNAENMSSHFLFVNWLAKYGYRIITFDYRGYGISEGEPDRAGMIKDGKAVLKYAKEVSDHNLFVIGQSLGGAIAVCAVERSEVAITALILDSSFASYRDIARIKLADFWLTWPLQWPLSYLVTDELSPIDCIKRVSMPTLFLHGMRDAVIPYTESQRLFEVSAAKDKEIWVTENMGHIEGLTEGSEIRSRFLNYIHTHASSNKLHNK